jgi:acyl-CoA thioesterase-2
MPTPLDDLVKLLALEPLEKNLFRGQSENLGWPRVFGGQVLGQALSAAVHTVPPERHVHSLHAYFLRPGDVTRPIVYEVDRIRDGSSFTTRRVVAIQHGEAIFNLAASFQVPEKGFEHQDKMPDVPPPESLETEQQRNLKAADKIRPLLGDRVFVEGPFDVRPVVGIDDPFHPTALPPHHTIWLRTHGQLPDDPGLHRYLLAYASDYAFIGTALRPHGVTWLTPGIQVASLDHVMWFHQPFRVDEWLLHVMDSPAAAGSRGLVRGSVFTRDGRLVASTAQEGLMRNRGTNR